MRHDEGVTHSPEPILFLSGAGLPAWIWDDTIELLSPGHETAIAARPTRKNPSLRDYARTALAAAPGDSFTVVAHSAGGVVAAELLRLAPGNITSLLAVSAVLPSPGASFMSSLPFPNRGIISLMTRLLGTKPPDSVIEKTLASRLDTAVIQRILADFTPESQNFYRDRVGAFSLPQHRGYLLTSEDAQFSRKLQEGFAAKLQPNYTSTLPTGHLPMLEAPQEIAREITIFLDSRARR